MDDQDVKLLVLCAGDPDSERAFSGSARSLIGALERRGCVVRKANVLGLTDSFQRGNLPMRLWRRLDWWGIEERYRWSRLAFRRNSRRASKIAQDTAGYNACLMYGTSFLPRLQAPLYCYFDATFAQVYQAGAWGFGGMSARHAASIHAFQRQVYGHCTGIFPRTAWAAHSVAEDFGVEPAKIHVAGAGPNHFAQPLPHEPYDQQIILFIGIEFERKGGPLLVEAFRRLRARLPGARLVIMGCTPPLDEPGIEIVGRISKDAPGGLQKILGWYAKASVFCIMSHFEPFGIVVLEAANSYVPCVAPERFAFPETIQNHVTGRLVPEYDAALLAEILEAMLRQPEALECMGRAAHEFVRAQWNWDAAADHIITQVRQDLSGAPRRK